VRDIQRGKYLFIQSLQFLFWTFSQGHFQDDDVLCRCSLWHLPPMQRRGCCLLSVSSPVILLSLTSWHFT